jgi:hypothetical protein
MNSEQSRNATVVWRTGCSLCGEIRTMWRGWVGVMFDPYRPELHYMRGPGPKWHAKHGVATAQTHRLLATAAWSTAANA